MIATMLTRTSALYMLCTVLLFANPVSSGMQKIVVDDADLARIAAAKDDIFSHVLRVSSSSLMEPYLNCDGYRELQKLDNKIIPFVIQDLVRIENSRVLYGKGHYQPLPKDNQEWLLRARQVADGTMPEFIYLSLLAGTSYGKAALRTGSERINEAYRWLQWWKENRDHYALTFKNAEKFDVGECEKEKTSPHLRCRMIDGLLNVRAVSATIKNIIDNAAAAAGVRAVVGNDGQANSFMGSGRTNIITSIDFRLMTFDEFAYAIAERVSIGYPWRKDGDTYYFGTGDPATGRWMVSSTTNSPRDLVCDIKMDRTVFRTSEQMPLEIDLRYLGAGEKGIEIIAGIPAEEYPVFVVQVVDEDDQPLLANQTGAIRGGELSTLKLGGPGNARRFVGEIDLSHFVIFAKPGDYTVTLTYKVGQDLSPGKEVWRGETVSGAVFVRIVD